MNLIFQTLLLNLSKISSENALKLLKKVENRYSKELRNLLSDMLFDNITTTEILEYPLIVDLLIDNINIVEDEVAEDDESIMFIDGTSYLLEDFYEVIDEIKDEDIGEE
jgi:hypothetical protein